jgi:sugar lactone lactonase YvrE
VEADLNDMVVDGNGRAFVSNFGYDPYGQVRTDTGIVVVDPDGTSWMTTGGLFRPNGVAITADARTFLVAETRVHRLTAFNLSEDGTLENARLFGDLGSGSWADGICVDEQNGVWVADPRRSRCLRMIEGTGIAQVVDTEVPAVACMLGDEDRRTLFIAEAPIRPMTEGARDPQGRIETVRVDVPGAGWP